MAGFPALLNFRSTLGYVTDGVGETAVLASAGAGEQYPTSRNGLTFGWLVSSVDTRDRLNTNTECAGMHFNPNDTTDKFQLDLPSTGTYDIRFAAGDASTALANTIKIFDNTTLLATVSGTPSAPDNYLDATGVNRTSQADWLSNNVKITKTFATTTFILQIGDGAGVTTGLIAHLEVTSVSTIAAFPQPGLQIVRVRLY